ncbi:MAG: hypothetical protein D6802_09540 [Ardenticatenia bacterium]|nr:MAG: hypothetical protein D6802_09540 [Ardenticatenia bacterium]
MVTVFDRNNRGVDGNLAGTFFGVKIGDGVAFFGAPHTGQRSRQEEHRLSRRGFACANVRHKRNVAQAFWSVLLHAFLLSAMKFLRNAIIGIRQSQNIERRKSYWLACILAYAKPFCNVCQLCFFVE